MPMLSLSTLSLAIAAVVAERQRLLARLATVSADVDAEEHLSEAVMDIDRALGELGSAYESLQPTAAGYPDYATLRAGQEASQGPA